MSPKENDVFRWSWREDRKSIIGCYAHLAVYLGGRIRDTYWHDWRTQSDIDPDRVNLTLLGNLDDYREIQRWDVPYYDPADIIDMSHANASRAPIYLRLTAEKNQAWMLARAEENFAEAQRAKDRAERDITEWQDKVKRIKAGDLEVYL